MDTEAAQKSVVSTTTSMYDLEENVAAQVSRISEGDVRCVVHRERVDVVHMRVAIEQLVLVARVTDIDLQAEVSLDLWQVRQINVA